MNDPVRTQASSAGRQGNELPPFAGLRVLLLAAHPDDEVLGAGGQFATMRHLTLVHLTDGASSQREAWSRGWRSRGRYAAARLRESLTAARLGGATVDHCCLGARDRMASFAMTETVVQLAAMLRSLLPDLVLTHAYEGGHADHDAAAFIAHAACRQVAAIPLWEMTGYHAAQPCKLTGRISDGFVAGVPAETGRFLPGPELGEVVVRLGPSELDAKRRMIAAFASQAHVLEELGTDLSVERFRLAPHYDFARAPHSGDLLYERQGWSRVTGPGWRALATEAAAAISLLNSRPVSWDLQQGRQRDRC